MVTSLDGVLPERIPRRAEARAGDLGHGDRARAGPCGTVGAAVPAAGIRVVADAPGARTGYPWDGEASSGREADGS